MGSAGVSSNGGLSNGVTGTKGEVIILGVFAATKSQNTCPGYFDWVRSVEGGKRGRGEGGGEAQRGHTERQKETSEDEEQPQGWGGGGGGDFRAADRLLGQQAVAF